MVRSPAEFVSLLGCLGGRKVANQEYPEKIVNHRDIESQRKQNNKKVWSSVILCLGGEKPFGFPYRISPPISSEILLTSCSLHQLASSAAIFSVARGSQKLAVPTWTAVAPASMNSITSAAVEMPPIPMTGICTDFEASYTIRTAIGLMAGPESPAVTLAIRGLRV